MNEWKMSGKREIEVEPGVTFGDWELENLCHVRNTEMARLTAERDQYKPFHDAVVDMAVVNWTYDAKTERDAHDAIKKLVHCYCMEACDPALNETLANLVAEKESAERKLAAVLEEIKPKGECPLKAYSDEWTKWVVAFQSHRRAVEIAEGCT